MDLDSADFPFIPARTQQHQHRFQSRSPSRPADPRTDPRSHRRSHPRSHNYSHSYSHQPLASTQPSTSASTTRPSTSSRHMGVPPASPEVIANLITSLSVLSSPTLTHGDPNVKFASLSLPATPHSTRHSPSLSLEYGAYSASPYTNFPPDETSDYFGEANPPPFSLKSKRMSGSPTRDHRSVNRDSANPPSSVPQSSTTESRPSSRASDASKHDDSRSQSIGNLTIERGAPPAPDLRPRKSIDSWCKKTSRNSKILLNLSPRELHRDAERNLSSPGVTPGLTPGGSGSSSGGYFSGRTDSSFADDPLSGGPTTPNDGPAADVPCPIPARDSSLRRTGIGKRLSGVRRSKRNSDGIIGDAIRESICEVPECLRAGDMRTIHRRVNSDLVQTASHNVDGGSPTAEKASSLYQVDMFEEEEGEVEEGEGKVPTEEDEGAPFPSVGQGRRRDEPGSDRGGGRLTERLSVGPQDSTRPKQSGSRLKRLSAGLGSPIDKRSSSNGGGGGGGGDESRAMPSGYERPKSADSVDDAVETYLCSPRLSQKIKHPQTGRVISFSEVGDPEGSAVFCCVGMGLTRYITAFYDELALTLKLRLITPDRPGVGGSEPCVDGTTTPLSWPDDVYAICQTLKITKFSILAHSAGAIYALATALRMSQHIRGRIHLLAPWIPPSQMSVFGTSQAQPPSTSLPTSQRILRALPTPILKAANSTFMSTNSFTSSLPKNPRRNKRKSAANSKDSTSSLSRNGTPTPDKDSFGNVRNRSNGGGSTESCSSDTFDKMPSLDCPNSSVSTILDGPPDFEAEKERQKTYDLRLTHAIWELATMHANPAVDLLVCLERQHTIGFRYVDITRPVVIHHGSKDNRVPVENVKWLGRAMRRCEVRVLEQEGHGLMASATVMGAVLMEISREWDDWIRATGADERK